MKRVFLGFLASPCACICVCLCACARVNVCCSLGLTMAELRSNCRLPRGGSEPYNRLRQGEEEGVRACMCAYVCMHVCVCMHACVCVCTDFTSMHAGSCCFTLAHACLFHHHIQGHSPSTFSTTTMSPQSCVLFLSASFVSTRSTGMLCVRVCVRACVCVCVYVWAPAAAGGRGGLCSLSGLSLHPFTLAPCQTLCITTAAAPAVTAHIARACASTHALPPATSPRRPTCPLYDSVCMCACVNEPSCERKA